MKLNNEFLVQADAATTWGLLTDLERIAPCMPGAALTGREGDDFIGTVKIKVGPIGANFQGKARFVGQDNDNHRATISMQGKDLKGAAAANATIYARLEPVSESVTRVYVDTDLDITGRMAQFGRGAIADVSNRLIGQFTANLGAQLEQPGPSANGATTQVAPAAAPPAAGPVAAPQPVAAPVAAPSVDLNALSLVGPVVAKQLAGPVIGFVLGWLVARAFSRRPR
ncbi:SRPBCC family protein [Streptomyces sp. NPDC057611]|uniref:SRPBCC family protein n=1 Tax=Streptomyces sp. NPDC057611 TaxID=3346182 RepID=UPI0036AB328D